MKVISIAILLSGLFCNDSFSYMAKTINPDDSYEEDINPTPRRERPKPSPKVEDEEEQFVHKDDTFVG